MIKRIVQYFDNRRQEERLHQLRMLQVFADQQLAAHEHSLKIFEGLTQEVLTIAKSQNDFFKSWLESFKVTELPTSSVVREEDEVRLEKERLREQGFPVDADIQEQVKWMLKDLGDGE